MKNMVFGVRRARVAAAVVVAMAAWTGAARADSLTGVDLSLVSAVEKIRLGQILKVRLLATTSPGGEVSIASVQSIISWDPTKLEFLGISANDPPHYPWLSAGMPDDSGLDNINDGVTTDPFIPFNDGDALFNSFSQPMPPAGIGPAVVNGGESLQVIVFGFRGIGETLSTPISLVPQIGSTGTAVFGTGAPGVNIVRSLTSTSVRVNIPEPSMACLLVVGAATILRRRRASTC